LSSYANCSDGDNVDPTEPTLLNPENGDIGVTATPRSLGIPHPMPAAFIGTGVQVDEQTRILIVL